LQSQGELKERKSKEMKAKLLSFLFINFSESRLFRALRRKKQKNPGPSYSPLRLRVKGLGRPQTDRPASAIRAHFAAPQRTGRCFPNHANTHTPSASPQRKQEISGPFSSSEKD
jgi:hypothetical protein